MSAVRLALLPRDGLFCKDGRGWYAAGGARGYALDWPWPTTLLGALRSAWGREVEGRRGRLFSRQEWLEQTRGVALGATLALRRPVGAPWRAEHRMWPFPADGLWLEGENGVVPLRPTPGGEPRVLGTPDAFERARDALWTAAPPARAKPRRPPRWWDEGRFVRWLAGEPVPVPDADLGDPVRRVDEHVGIHPRTAAAEEGVLYAHEVVETLEGGAEWAIGIEAVLPEDVSLTWVPLGGDRRLARAEGLDAEAFAPPAALLSAFRAGPSGLRLFVVTPAQFERGWLPDGFAPAADGFRGVLPGLDVEVVLRAAMVPRSLALSGWDMARGQPKPTVRAVPPGAVYFVQRVDGGRFGEEDARRLWLAPWGGGGGEGFGRVVAGVWREPGRGGA